MMYGYGALSARVYGLDKPVGTSFGDVEFYLRALEGVSGVILEPGVGTGRILIPLLQAGLRVEGGDTSPEMLKICRDGPRPGATPGPATDTYRAGGDAHYACMSPPRVRDRTELW